MTTASDIITDAVHKLKVYGPGETVLDADLATGLVALNAMLDFMSNDGATCFAILEQSVALTPNKQSYTIGTSGGADINATRPLKLIYGSGTAKIVDSNGVQYSLDVWPQTRWNQLGYPKQTADFPTTLFYDPQYPLGILNFYPIPTLPFTAYWDSYLQLGQLANYQSALSFPPGYEAMLRWNLPIWLKSYYKSKPIAQIDPEIPLLAKRTLDAVKRTNRRMDMADYDTELLVRGTAAYNVYTDSYVR